MVLYTGPKPTIINDFSWKLSGIELLILGFTISVTTLLLRPQGPNCKQVKCEDGSICNAILTLNMLNILNGLVPLPFVGLSIINFRDINLNI
jgi:hypothetical protein